MAATFVVETGTASTTANSYVSVADSDQYHENYTTTSTTWTDLTQEQKELALRLATQAVENWYRGQWRGIQTTPNQALAFPRSSLVVEGALVGDNVIPQQLKDAVSYLALQSRSATLVPDLTTPGEIKRKKVQAGPVSQDITYVGGSSQNTQYSLVDGMLANLLHSNTQFERS